jgi:hypothetical protein
MLMNSLLSTTHAGCDISTMPLALSADQILVLFIFQAGVIFVTPAILALKT